MDVESNNDDDYEPSIDPLATGDPRFDARDYHDTDGIGSGSGDGLMATNGTRRRPRWIIWGAVVAVGVVLILAVGIPLANRSGGNTKNANPLVTGDPSGVDKEGNNQNNDNQGVVLDQVGSIPDNNNNQDDVPVNQVELPAPTQPPTSEPTTMTSGVSSTTSTGDDTDDDELDPEEPEFPMMDDLEQAFNDLDQKLEDLDQTLEDLHGELSPEHLQEQFEEFNNGNNPGTGPTPEEIEEEFEAEFEKDNFPEDEIFEDEGDGIAVGILDEELPTMPPSSATSSGSSTMEPTAGIEDTPESEFEV